MINKQKILGIIPARGGSKGVPRKNIKILGGKPLIQYTIEAALKSKYIGRLIVSTDDKEIAEIAMKNGVDVPFIRPKKYSTDTAKAIAVVKHALVQMEKIDNKKFSVIVYLEPPAPFRTSADIDNSIELFFENKPGSVVTVNNADQFHPILMKKIVNNRLKPIWKEEPEGVPRQLYSPKAYMRNGAVYVLSRANIISNKFYGSPVIPYIMPDERSLCIDSYLDWYAAEALLTLKAKSQSRL